MGKLNKYMPKEYSASRQPEDLFHAESAWMNEGVKGHEQFHYEVRETKEFTIWDLWEPLNLIYGLKPDHFGSIKIKKESSGGAVENAELFLKPEISMLFFGHQVSFEFTVEGRIAENVQSQVTNLSRNDYYDDGDIRGESLADYDRTTGRWRMQPNKLQINKI